VLLDGILIEHNCRISIEVARMNKTLDSAASLSDSPISCFRSIQSSTSHTQAPIASPIRASGDDFPLRGQHHHQPLASVPDADCRALTNYL
jgi:hypothetical protein